MEGAIDLPKRVNKNCDEGRWTLLAWSRRLFIPAPYVADKDDCNARYFLR